MKFQIGDICIVRNHCVSPHAKHLIGTECTVLAYGFHGKPADGFEYTVECVDGNNWGAMEYHLMKKPPPESTKWIRQQTCDWKSTGFIPFRLRPSYSPYVPDHEVLQK